MGIDADICTAKSHIACFAFSEAKLCVIQAEVLYYKGEWEKADDLLHRAARKCCMARIEEARIRHASK